MAGQERRKEHRYVVDSVYLTLGEERFPVIDIAASGARISCAPREFDLSKSASCRLEFGNEGALQIFAIEPRLVRSTDLYVVVGYSPPVSEWEAFIRTFDTFHVRELDDHLFD